MSSIPYYAEDLALIGAVTKALNELPTSDSYALRVQLLAIDGDTNDAVIGEWSDEIAPDAWSYRETWQEVTR